MNQLNFLNPRNFAFVFFILIVAISCKTRDKNYIIYYQKVVEIDSIYRLADNPKKATKKYKKLFRKYEPKNQEKIEEYATYIELADEYNMNFGGQKSLRKLIHLVAPYAHENGHKRYYDLFEKYGIDSSEVEREIAIWRSGLDKELIDSFSIALDRDQLPLLAAERDDQLIELSRKQNFQLLKWAFENGRYPSLNRIGIKGNYERNFHFSGFYTNLAGIQEYEYLKNKLYEYVKSGDCTLQDYATLLDMHEGFYTKKVPYLIANTNDDGTLDSAFVNKNRKELGLPSIKHSVKIRQDFWKKMKEFHGE